MTDCAGRTPISHAAEVGSREIVMILLDSGDEVRLRDSVGRNPLSHAAEAGQQHIVEILLGTDVDVDSPDVVGRTAMSWAAERGQQAVCKRLHARGADVKTKDKYGWTPILWAARGGHSSVLQQILMTNDSTSSPAKNLASAILLAVSGKSRSWRTEYQTPLSWALKNGFNDVADCLLVELQRQFLALRRAGALPLQARLERRSLWSCALLTHRELSFVFSLGASLPPFLSNQVTLRLHFRCS